MALERTLSIIKPDGVRRNLIGRIFSRFETNGLTIIATRMHHLSRAEAEGFYAVHKARPFFNDLVTYMTRGPVVVSGPRRRETPSRSTAKSDGRHQSEKAAPGTIRADFRPEHRRQYRARQRRPRDRGGRDRLLLPHHRDLRPLIPRRWRDRRRRSG
jgi:nucleoside-diphosphate kinase